MTLSRSPHTKLRRAPERGSYDREAVDAILDEALVSHLGFVDGDGRPNIIPTLHVRDGDDMLVHGSAASRYVKALRKGEGLQVCLETTLLDGIVLARSAFNHSINYRSVILYGQAQEITGDAARMKTLELFTNRLVPGRWADVRWPDRKELRATAMLRLPILEGSAKIRTGPPGDLEDDHALDSWAGVVPMKLTASAPEDDPRLRAGIPRPAYIDDWVQRRTAPAPG